MAKKKVKSWDRLIIKLAGYDSNYHNYDYVMWKLSRAAMKRVN